LRDVQPVNCVAGTLYELPDRAAWLAEIDAHTRLADELRLPAYRWYAPLWAAVRAEHEGRFAEALELVGQARIDGGRAADRNAELFCEMLVTGEAMLRGSMDEADTTLLQDKLAHSPAAMSWRSALAWIRAAEGRDDDARRELASVAHDGYAGLRFDANWLNAVGELAEACRLLADRDRAAELYAFLEPYADAISSPVAPWRSYGVADRTLACSRRRWAVTQTLSATSSRRSRGTRRWASSPGLRTLARALGRSCSRPATLPKPSERVTSWPALRQMRAASS